MKSRRHGTGTAARLVALLVVAVILNYPWELVQSGLFVKSVERGVPWWHCFVASLGDGLLVWVIYACGWTMFRRADWFERPRSAQYALMLTIGGLIGVVVAWVAVHRRSSLVLCGRDAAHPGAGNWGRPLPVRRARGRVAATDCMGAGAM